MDTRVSIDTAALLEEVSWVQALARRLVRDAGEAEDVAQEAVLAALRGSREEPRALRQWLGAVVRNLGHDARRRRSRRSRVEGPLETEPALPSTLELLERAATQRALVGVLMELDEPYRSVLLLRYFQGLSNEAIARREGLPASTVATRLARAHERLRAKWLAQNGGDRSTALAALAVFAEGLGEVAPVPAVPLSAALGRALPRAALGAFSVGGLVAVLLGGAWFLRDTSSPRVAREPDLHRPAAAVLTEPAAPTSSSSSMEATADALAAFLRHGREALPAAPSSQACPVKPELIHGRVLDLDGRPVAGLVVCRVAPFVTRPGEPSRRGAPVDQRATTGEDGRFVLEAPRHGRLTVSAPGWTTVLSAELWPARGETLLVVERARGVSGVVASADGRALEGVEVVLEVASQRLLGLGPLLDEVEPLPRSATTDRNGAFAFDGAPSAALVVTAHKDGFEPRSLELGDFQTSAALRIELLPSSLPSVIGRVVDAAGAPVAEASVSLGQRIATSDASGAFHVDFDPAHRHGDPAAGSVLRASREGVGYAQQEIALPDAGEPPLDVLVVLADQALAIEGRVLDPRGEPVPSVQVFVREDTPFGRTPIADSSRAWWVERSLEEALGAEVVHTSADGSFRIEGLAERDYRLEALDESRLIRATSAPVPAGSRAVELVLDRGAVSPLAGRVVDRAGRPVPGVRVSVSLRKWWSGPGDRTGELAIGLGTDTDAEGRFALEGVAREGIFLQLGGESIVPELFRDIDTEPERTALELVVARRCTLQLHWGDWSARADHLHLEAEDGSRLEFMDPRGLSVTPMDSMPVETELSPAITIPDRAAHAVLTRDGTEVTRVRLHPVPGELVFVNL